MTGHAGSHGGTPSGTPRGGARRAAKPKRTVRPRLLLLGLAALAALAAWAFLVWAAIDFGRSARGGDSGAWAYLAMASVGAVACLFLCLLLVTVLLRRVGILEQPERARAPKTHIQTTHTPKAPHRH